jgi:hypothetical protein
MNLFKQAEMQYIRGIYPEQSTTSNYFLVLGGLLHVSRGHI